METIAKKRQAREDTRAHPRRRALLGGTIVYGDEMLTVECKIRDWSENGVKVELPTAVLLPKRFWFIEHRLGFAHEAKRVWRRGQLAGLELLVRRGLDPATDRNLKVLRRIWMDKLPRSTGRG